MSDVVPSSILKCNYIAVFVVVLWFGINHTTDGEKRLHAAGEDDERADAEEICGFGGDEGEDDEGEDDEQEGGYDSDWYFFDDVHI